MVIGKFFMIKVSSVSWGNWRTWYPFSKLSPQPTFLTQEKRQKIRWSYIFIQRKKILRGVSLKNVIHFHKSYLLTLDKQTEEVLFDFALHFLSMKISKALGKRILIFAAKEANFKLVQIQKWKWQSDTFGVDSNG